MLIHLKIRKNIIGRKNWKPCTCPPKPGNMTTLKTWQHLLRIYKNPRTAKIRDVSIPNHDYNPDDSTSGEEITPSQNALKVRRPKIEQQEKQLRNGEKQEKQQPEQHAEEQRLNWLTWVHETLQRHEHEIPGHSKGNIPGRGRKKEKECCK